MDAMLSLMSRWQARLRDGEVAKSEVRQYGYKGESFIVAERGSLRPLLVQTLDRLQTVATFEAETSTDRSVPSCGEDLSLQPISDTASSVAMNQILPLPMYFPSSSTYPPSPPFPDQNLSGGYDRSFASGSGGSGGVNGNYGEQYVEELSCLNAEGYGAVDQKYHQPGESRRTTPSHKQSVLKGCIDGLLFSHE